MQLPGILGPFILRANFINCHVMTHKTGRWDDGDSRQPIIINNTFVLLFYIHSRCRE
jgi:hypothetical protein